MGGKHRIAKQIAAVIDNHRAPGQPVWDAFCGGLSCTRALREKGPVWSTDANAALIALYRQYQLGWRPPADVDKSMWAAAKSLPDTDPLKAFCALACSYGGVWFAGYQHGRLQVSGKYDSYTDSGRSALARSVRRDSNFAAVDFMSVEPQPCDAILYLDPPYRGTAQYRNCPAFDHDLFVDRVRAWSKFTDVYVSEYSFPIGECVWQRTAPGGCGLAKRGAVECLYYIGPRSGSSSASWLDDFRKTLTRAA